MIVFLQEFFFFLVSKVLDEYHIQNMSCKNYFVGIVLVNLVER